VARGLFSKLFDRPRPGEDAADNDRVRAARRALFARMGGRSDHVLLSGVYLHWADLRGRDKRDYCDSLGLVPAAMREAADLFRTYDGALRNLGFRRRGADAGGNAIARACAVAALAPSNVLRVRRPATKYAETVEGAVEKDGVAREFMFFAPPGKGGIEEECSNYQGDNPQKRVFLHPSSFLFERGTYGCPYLVYFRLMHTSKPFAWDLTECTTYALLLFGGEMTVKAKEGLIFIDCEDGGEDHRYQWVIRFKAHPRIGALMAGLRERFDELLLEKVRDPDFDIAGTEEMKIIVNLLLTDGWGQVSTV